MRKKIVTLLLVLFLIGTVNRIALGYRAPENPLIKDYSMGWQYSRPMNGLTVKIPVYENYFLQPVVSFNSSEDDHLSKGWYSAGMRAFVYLPKRQDFQPYTGIGIGHYKRYEETGGIITESVSGNGYEAFIGVEYQKYIVRPSLEIGMGSYTKTNGDHFGGLSLNAGLVYYF